MASSSSSHVPAGAVDEPFQGVFRTFPRRKKVRRSPAPRSGTGCGLQLMASMTLAGLGAVGYGTVVKGIDMGAALLWLLSYKYGPGWCVSSGLLSYAAVASGAAAGAG